MKLYGYWRSSCTWRVRIGLALKGIEAEIVPVHLVQDGGHQHGEEFRSKNPMRQLPVLELADGTRLSQSLAILEYLEEVNPTPALLPGSPTQRALIRQLAEVINSGVQPLQNLGVMQKLKAESDVNTKQWSAYWIERGLRAFEAMLPEDGPFCVGAEPTLADVCLIPQLYNARRFDVDLTTMPRLLAVEGACEALPAFEVAHPDRQPDAVA